MTGVVLLQEEPLALAGGDGHGPGLQPLEAAHPPLPRLLLALQTLQAVEAGHSRHPEPPETLTRGHTAHQDPGNINTIKIHSQHDISRLGTWDKDKINCESSVYPMS